MTRYVSFSTLLEQLETADEEFGLMVVGELIHIYIYVLAITSAKTIQKENNLCRNQATGSIANNLLAISC